MKTLFKTFSTEKYVVSFLVFVFLAIPYFGISHYYGDLSVTVLPLRNAIDDQIPLVPFSIWYYLGGLYLTAIASVFLFQTRVSFYLSMLCAILCGSFCFVIFSVFPTVYPQPTLNYLGVVVSNEGYQTWSIPGDWLSSVMMTYLYKVDKPVNTFPSLHVTYGMILYLGIVRDRPNLNLALGLNAFLLYVTTLTTKQHFVLDGLVGGLLAYIVFKVLEGPVSRYFINKNES